MLKRLIIFILIIGGVLYFALKDDNATKEEPSLSEQLEERAENMEKEGGSEEVKTEEGEENKAEEKEEMKEEVKAEPKTETPVTETTTSTTTETNTSVVIGPQPAEPEVVAVPAKPVVKPLTAADVQQQVKVFLYEWDIDVSDLQIGSGVTEFMVQNTGRFSHNFGIKGGTDFGNLRPGETRSFIARVNAGNVVLYSSKTADVERGMQEVLTAR